MSSFEKVKTPGIKEKAKSERTNRVPEGMWFKCTSCGEVMETKVLQENHYICVECNHHFRMSARERIHHLTSGQAFEEYGEDLRSSDPLEFYDLKPYKERLEAAIKKHGQNDAFLSGRSKIGDTVVQIGAFDFKFMGGSMGTVVGERITLLFEHALKEETPVVLVSASGGARMQESILSLMQMAKTSAFILEMRKAGLPYISLLTDPTTGGVAASFAMLGDVILAEPKALIGFAGPRVIEQTIRQKLPEGFQTSEFLLQQGFVDQVVPRENLPSTVAMLLQMMMWSKNGNSEKNKKRKTKK
ncbi:MAG: acetyl-CoA carboxylase, carboxyltransferase subunit beta [Oligoflexia bacterium]|nr:acetyl-CoA carboxylase, carboxyltransferase subunit beta [Oligoflexia bacterium]